MNYGIIMTDNFARDTVSEQWLITPHLRLNQEEAEAFTKLINQKCDPSGPWYYRAVPGDYKLYKWEP